jgi:cold shock CspA family protein/ribosome-associated translation inhibitor RaiA
MTMETPVQVDFQGMEPTAQLQEAVSRQLAGLEDKFGRITAGRIVIKGPGEHHRTGGQYDINIRLKLPDGREVNVARTPQDDERYSQIEFALADAFKRARRQLEDEVRLLRGQTKLHVPQPMATVASLFEDHGFLDGGEQGEIYFHMNSVLDGGFAKLKPGSSVSYVAVPGEKGLQASTVKLLGKHGMR